MKLNNCFVLFFWAASLIIASACSMSALAESPYEINKDYWFSDAHTIKTNDVWTFHILELGEYNVTGRVGAIKYYRESHLPFSPLDVCMGWGKIIEPPHYKWSNFSMGDRNCEHVYQAGDYRIELSSDYIDAHVANNHLIPSNKKIFDKLMALRDGDFIEIRGLLVSVTGENKNGTYLHPWTSDTKGTFRECEIILVKDIEVLDLPEEYWENFNFLDELKYKSKDEKRDITFITMVAVMLIILVIFLLKKK